MSARIVLGRERCNCDSTLTWDQFKGRGSSEPRLRVVELLAAMHPAVVQFDHGARLTDPAVAGRVVLHGVAVSRVRTAGVIACSCVVRRGGDGSSRADDGGA